MHNMNMKVTLFLQNKTRGVCLVTCLSFYVSLQMELHCFFFHCFMSLYFQQLYLCKLHSLVKGVCIRLHKFACYLGVFVQIIGTCVSLWFCLCFINLYHDVFLWPTLIMHIEKSLNFICVDDMYLLAERKY